MSTGKRLAKRSIIGTRVCAPGPDGLWYSGVIIDVKTPKNTNHDNNNCINLTSDTKYSVRFDFKTQQFDINIINNQNLLSNIITTDNMNPLQSNIMITPAQSVRRNAMIKEFHENELIGPGFRTIMGVQLHPGQRVFLTYNGRETSGDVLCHDQQNDEVTVKITPIGYEEPLELKKRLEEVRLLESRRSARLADQERDTDFARLADMAGDRRRASHSIDVPLALTQHNSRKRRPSYSQDERDNYLPQFRDDDQMDACNAALVLMSLSCSPHSPRAGQWNTMLGSSPGSSSASWSSSGTSSPPLSDDGTTPPVNDNTARIRTTSLSTSDEGIVMDYSDEAPRKRRAAHGPIFQCTWKGCRVIETTVQKIELHVRNAHLGPKKPRHSYTDDGTFSDSDHEEEFYYTEIEDEGKAPSPPSPPTLSHRDMARPPHEDPEYQRQIVGNFRQGLLALSQSATIKSSLHVNAGPINIPTSPLAHHNYTWAQQSPVSPHKHARWSPRPSTSSAPYPSPTTKITFNHQQQQQQQQHHNYNQTHHNFHQNITTIQQQHGVHNNHQGTTTITNLSHSAPASTTSIMAANNHNNNNNNNNSNNNNNNINSNNVNLHHQLHQSHHNNHHQHQHHQLTGLSTITTPSIPPPTTTQQQQQQQQQHQTTNTISSTTGGTTISGVHRSPQSPNRRTRGENKKCRKVYGMDHKDQWCTQCKWKKACSRFGD